MTFSIAVNKTVNSSILSGPKFLFKFNRVLLINLKQTAIHVCNPVCKHVKNENRENIL